MSTATNNSCAIEQIMSNVANNTCGIDFTSDQVILPVVYGFVFCIGLPTNFLALYGLYRLVKTENVLPVFVINLLLSDLLQISTLPFWMDYYRNIHVWNFGLGACSIIGCIFYISMFVSIFFLCCIALERYLAIVHPLWFRKYGKLRNTCLICVGLWVFVISVTSVAFKLGFEDAESSLCMEKYPSDRSFAVFQLVAMAITFPLPLCFLVFLYRGIQKNITKVISVPDEEKKRIVGLLSLIIIIFILVFGPFHLMCYVNYMGVLLFEDSCDYESRTFIYFQFAIGLLSLNSALDPIMYLFLRKDYRKVVINSFPHLQRLSIWSLRLAANQADSTSVQTAHTV
ncbi:G-protein coupled receptor 4-like [Acipenser oxyrinchus oxyrinchus]|uniref:G-protein coupled receptor 4-like n=1 Tax=Acipenser oxyrinchus oxyrinchus TaxID=40147 RepID=A0AAD8LU39_ACIOX|nr:G-protein coupled receptor 4-like [Acipenser oxyrinchus oxyrinchus]